MQLCLDLMSSPSYNVNREARMQELARRGENCSAYGSIPAAQAEADRQQLEILKATIPPPQPPPRPVTCYKNANGSVTCY